jgi:hypothetical protein
MSKAFVRTIAAAALLTAGYAAGRASAPEVAVEAAQGGKVYELRTYTTHEGKLPALHARFRDHTLKLFQKHGMTNVAYWTPADAPQSQNTLIYVISHESREAAKKSWDAFRNDPDWQKARKESEAAGPIVSNVVSVFMTPTDYSAMK